MKAHLTSSDDPLIEGHTYIALCREEIPKSVFVFMFNTETANFRESLNSINTCAKCLGIEVQGRYVYGLIEGQDMR